METLPLEEWQEYKVIYWPNLQKVIHLFLTNPSGIGNRISFEEMYSYVYKCVCKQMADTLQGDLLSYVRQHLMQVNEQLRSFETSPQLYLRNLNTAINIHLQGVDLIAKIFTYMNRFYLESRMQTDLKTVLLQQFTQIIIGPSCPKLLVLIEEMLSVPFSLPPDIMANLIKNLYFLNPDLAKDYPQVFTRFIPNVLPSMDMEDIPLHIAETQRMQQQMLLQGFQSGDNSRKRPGDNDQTMPR